METFAPELAPVTAFLDSKTQRAYLLQSFKGEVRKNIKRDKARDSKRHAQKENEKANETRRGAQAEYTLAQHARLGGVSRHSQHAEAYMDGLKNAVSVTRCGQCVMLRLCACA